MLFSLKKSLSLCSVFAAGNKALPGKTYPRYQKTVEEIMENMNTDLSDYIADMVWEQMPASPKKIRSLEYSDKLGKLTPNLLKNHMLLKKINRRM